MFRMTRRKLLSASLGGAAGWALWTARERLGFAGALLPSARPSAVAAPVPPPGRLVTRSSRALGTAISITIAHPDSALAERAIERAFSEVREIEQVLSVYLPDSQVSRLNRGEKLADAHPHLLAMLAASLDLSRRSGGAFDVTVQPLWETWAAAAKAGRLPPDEAIDAARTLVDWRSIVIEGEYVWFRKRGTKITFNGIAQGYATEHARVVLEAQGITHAMVDVGELAAMGDKPPGEPWKVGIQHPRQEDAYVWVAGLKDRALATSGDYETHFSDDRKFNHIFDPATGRSPTEFASVSIAAPRASQADGLSTAVFVLGYEKGLKLVSQTPEADVLFVFKDGRVVATPGFPREA
jgi:thiamine biosynthesis lipoprotein